MSVIFNAIDTSIIDASFDDLVRWETQIYQEYKWVGPDVYKEKRIEFLEKSIPDHLDNSHNLRKLIEFIKLAFMKK